MEEVYQNLANRALSAHEKRLTGSSPRQYHHRTLIALAGAPGSGKSTISVRVTRRINDLAGRAIAAVVPMDGFHHARAHLDTLPNRDEAHARRGAHWTFDAAGVLALAERLARDTAGVVSAPGFDHAAKDPVADAVRVGRDVEIVVLEGNWLLYDVEPWRRIAALADDAWFVEVSPAVARERIARRHLEAGIEDTWDAAIARAEGNDLPNGEEIRRCLVEPGVVVYSWEE